MTDNGVVRGVWASEREEYLPPCALLTARSGL